MNPPCAHIHYIANESPQAMRVFACLITDALTSLLPSLDVKTADGTKNWALSLQMSFKCVNVCNCAHNHLMGCQVHYIQITVIITYTAVLLLSVPSSIVNVPGEWTLRREFLRLQTEDREGGREGGHAGSGAQRQQVGFNFMYSLLYIHSFILQ